MENNIVVYTAIYGGKERVYEVLERKRITNKEELKILKTFLRHIQQ